MTTVNTKKTEPNFAKYEAKFKALADQKRLQIMYELCMRDRVCVCDLCDIVDMPQSKLSYHLKILLEAELIKKETSGTWSFYTLDNDELGRILSGKVCALFNPTDGC